ncbi:YhbY family RNA-binding protein [Castellaniella sp.]|uniref:YhbY family RNA-binding protein n=1 Tax=Castellaniella sp. TaxID=1955812 RepID=UPI002AFEF7EE|nr:YhbY family RNA-binding protein [Castellaniella sp.]
MPKLELTPQQRRDLRAAAHPLHPVVMIGDKGLTDAVLGEIDRSLTAHELIKIRASGAERPDRDAMLETICDALSCAPVHHLGKTLIIYRPDVLAQQAAADALNATRALRKKSDPYVPKKQAANPASASTGHKPKQTGDASDHESLNARRRRQTDERRDPADGRPGARRARPSDTGRTAAAAHGIPRRGNNSALSLRAGARRGSR